MSIDYSELKGHTKGPWSVMSGRPTIVIMPEASELGNGHKYASLGGGNNEANARLVAAAPALLERNLVLESVVENMKGGLTPQTVALAKALERGRVADREIDALSDEALHLRVQNDMQRRAIEKLKAQII